jgi:hypothetical protein
MSKSLILAASFCLLPLVAFSATASVTGDTYISSANPTLNFGNLATLNVGPGTAVLIQLDLSSLPPGLMASGIQKASLTVFANKVFTAGGLDVAQVTSAWSESTATFNMRPTTAAPFLSNVPTPVSDTFVTFDITSLVQQWVTTPSINFGLQVTSAVAQPNTTVNLDSKEATATSHSAFADITLVSGEPRDQLVQQDPQD